MAIGDVGAGFSEHQQEPAFASERDARATQGGTPRGVGALFGELLGETSALVRAEATLARSEMRENMQSMQRGLMAMATGGAVLFAGLLSLVAAVILALALVIPGWLAAMIVGIVVAVLGMIMLGAGRRTALEEGLRPERTLSSLGEMKNMARIETGRATRKWR